jgi:Tol biopolymer transport system component
VISVPRRFAHRLHVALLAIVVTLAVTLVACGAAGATLPDPPNHGAPPAPTDPTPEPTEPTPEPGNGEPAPTPPVDGAAPAAGTYRVAVHSDGTPANATTRSGVLNHTGRYVAFASPATNLVDGDTNGVADVFVHDLVGRTTERVSVSTAGEEADGESFGPSLSADGRYVAFTSPATKLIAGDANGVSDVFVRDRAAGTTERVSLTAAGLEADGPSQGIGMSPDGRYVFFASEATNLVGVGDPGPGTFVRDRTALTTDRLPDPRFVDVAFAGRFVTETTGTSIVVRDLVTGDVDEIDVGATEPALHDPFAGGASDDGRSVGFHALGVGAWNVFVHDRVDRTNELISVRAGGAEADEAFSFHPTLSADGRFVLFASQADDLVAADPFVGWSLFVRDRDARLTRRVPVESGPTSLYDTPGDALSADGRSVLFTTFATIVREGYEAGVTGIDAHPDAFEEIFVHVFDTR